MIYVVLALIGVLSGMISGIVGTGSSIILLPILAYIFGAKLAVPIMAIAAIMGNISRVMLWRHELNIKAFLLFTSVGIPAAVLGANTLWGYACESVQYMYRIVFYIIDSIATFCKT
ncbi:TSUP family transporter [Acinetobacter sp. 1207_04]|uniref:TSUP family transporter n=1 Tax=Acinetobacter sp. 1207_04 TaxID=2604449 RepID=UPI0040596859